MKPTGVSPTTHVKRRLEAAELAWLAAGAGLAAADVWLVRGSRGTLTGCARAHPRVTYGLLLLLAAHFADRLGRADPFRAVGFLVARQLGVTVDEPHRSS